MNSLANEYTGDQGIAMVFDHTLYTRLSGVAAGLLKREGRSHGWEPADLLHEAFLRIACGRSPIQFQSISHVIALTTVVIRHILTDRSRSTAIFNRCLKVSLDPDLPANCASRLEGISVRNALERLRDVHRRAYQVVEMHAIYGMALAEIASRLSVSSRTVKRDWKVAREWLGGELADFSVRKTTRHSRRATKRKIATISQPPVIERVRARSRLADVA
jgi:RNA polymerase sigma-70 factor, ECF subfamily